jgi:hypothetical protein
MPDAACPLEGQGGVLALDAASRITGWCYGQLSWDAPWFGNWHMPFMGGEGMCYVAFENELIDAIDDKRPAQIVLESPLSRMVADSNERTVNLLRGLRAIVRLNAARGWEDEQGERHPIAVSEVSADLVRGEILGFSRVPGHPKAIKQHIVLGCRRRGWKVPDDNSGDACLLWEWHRRRVAGPRQHRLLGVAAA